MGEQPKRKEPTFARTNFESMTHEQLVAMLDSASSEGAAELAGKLTKAASTITKIGDDLMTYVKGLEWQGEGGDAFRDWGGQTAGATLRLGQYVEVASRWMATVAQAVSEAKSAIPATSETTQAKADLAKAHKTLEATQEPGARNDPDARRLAQAAQSDAAAAEQRMEAARAEAVQQLRKLAQTYEYSAQQVNSVQPPTFSPPADHSGERTWWETSQEDVPAGSVSRGGGTTYGASSPASGGIASVPTIRHTLPEHSSPTLPREQPGHSSVPAAMDIDGVATLPESTTPVTTVNPGPPAGGLRPEAQSPIQPGAVPPSFSNGRTSNMPSALPRIPSSARPPLLPGQPMPGSNAARLPRETGIVGGRPVAPGSRPATGSIPRGTVIGQGGVQGRAPMTRGIVPGMPGGASTGPSSGLVGGRRLSSEAGGPGGNRQVQPERNTARPFTPGGSGLVRQTGNGPSSSASTQARTAAGQHSPTAPASRRGQESGNRPDYLVEDEETWRSANRRAVPPVVD